MYYVACNCDDQGSATTSCNKVGVCTCKTSFFGEKCHKGTVTEFSTQHQISEKVCCKTCFFFKFWITRILKVLIYSHILE